MFLYLGQSLNSDVSGKYTKILSVNRRVLDPQIRSSINDLLFLDSRCFLFNIFSFFFFGGEALHLDASETGFAVRCSFAF